MMTVVIAHPAAAIAPNASPTSVFPPLAKKPSANAEKREDDAQPLHRVEALAAHEEMHAQCGKARREVEEHDHARGRREFEPAIDEHELGAEHRADEETVPQGSIAGREFDAAHSRPRQHQHGGDDRAQACLHHGRHPARRDLDRHLLQAPARAQKHHQGDGDGVQGFAVIGHGAEDGACGSSSREKCSGRGH
jgi:hypothetical protein